MRVNGHLMCVCPCRCLWYIIFSFINIQFRSWQNTDLETMGPKVWTCLFVFLASRSFGLCSVLMVISQGEIFYWIQIQCLIGVCGLKRRKSRPKWCWGPTLAKILSTFKHITQLYLFCWWAWLSLNHLLAKSSNHLNLDNAP